VTHEAPPLRQHKGKTIRYERRTIGPPPTQEPWPPVQLLAISIDMPHQRLNRLDTVSTGRVWLSYHVVKGISDISTN